VPATELEQNRRQVEPWEGGAFDQLRSGNASQALDDYDAAGRVQRAGTGADARCALTAAWWTAATSDGTRAPTEQVVMLAVRRTDVDELNLRARAHREVGGRYPLSGSRTTDCPQVAPHGRQDAPGGCRCSCRSGGGNPKDRAIGCLGDLWSDSTSASAVRL
jgi:hypothetical protein